MKQRTVVEVAAESYIEEQLLLEKFPEAVWINLGGSTIFYLDENSKQDVIDFIQECEERGV
jgi:hypothetical protein